MKLWQQIALGIIVFGLCSYGLNSLINNYPFPTEHNRDWLNILSDLGKASGSAALLAIIIQIFWKRKENDKKHSPNVQVISVDVVDSIDKNNPPANCILCVCEDIEADLPTDSSFYDYKRLWEVLDPNGQKFLKITLKNHHREFEANANDVMLFVKLKLLITNAGLMGQEFNLKCPPNAQFNLEAEEEKSILINLSLNAQYNQYKLVEGFVNDYECRNTLGRLRKGNNLRFKPFEIINRAI